MSYATTRNGLYIPEPTDTVTVPALGQSLAEGIDYTLDKFRAASGTKFYETLAMWEDKNPNLSGYMLIETGINATTADKMFRFDIRGYTYQSVNNILDIQITFYLLSSTLYSVDFNNNGTMLVRDVRVLKNNTTNQLAICLRPDNIDNYWHYPKAVVDMAVAWSTEVPDSEIESTSIRLVSTLTGYTALSGGQVVLSGGDWKAPTLLNGWVNYDANPGTGINSHSQAGYRKIRDQVYLQGLIKNGSLTNLIFTLPAGYRPAGGILIFAQHCGGTWGRVDVDSGGNIYSNGIPNNSYLSLNGISFPVTG